MCAEQQSAGEWIKKNPDPATELRAPVIGFAAPTVESANPRRTYRVQPADALAEQQSIANSFKQAQILTRRVSIAESPVWRAT